jgi:hypothetical protein
MRWADLGFFPVRTLPFEGRRVRMVRETTFLTWALKPENWIYFNLGKVNDAHLRRLLALKARRWGDEWLTPGQVARLHGIDHRAVNKALHDGRLQGVKWNNWRILRSQATAPGLRFFRGKGSATGDWPERADAFIVLATAVGLAPDAVAALMGGKRSRLAWTGKRVAYRLAVLKRQGRIPHLISEHDLTVAYARGRLFADWKDYRKRFPALAQAMKHLKAGQALDGAELSAVRRVLAVWATWHRQAALTRSLVMPNFRQVGEALADLRTRGIDPFTRRN